MSSNQPPSATTQTLSIEERRALATARFSKTPEQEAAEKALRNSQKAHNTAVAAEKASIKAAAKAAEIKKALAQSELQEAAIAAQEKAARRDVSHTWAAVPAASAAPTPHVEYTLEELI